jgi:predicted NBD/HSP70 family sugar kinase
MWCGRRGCLDTVATHRPIAQRILRDQRLAALWHVTQETDVGAIYQRFGQLVREDVPEVVALFEAVADRLVAVVLDLVNSLDLDLVSLAGPGLAQLGGDFQRAIQRRVTDLSYLRTVHPVVVRFTAGDIDTAALGAASVVLHRNFTPHHFTPSR